MATSRAALGVELRLMSAIAVYFLSVAFSSLILSTARGLGRIKAFAVTGISQSVVSIASTIFLVYVYQLGPLGMILGLSAGTLLPAIVLSVAIRIHAKIKLSTRDSATKKELLTYALPLIPNSISWWAFNASDRTIIYFAISAAANGIYAVSNRFSGVLTSFWNIFYMSWSETAALNIDEPGRDILFSKVANVSVKVFGSLAFFGVAATALVSPFLINDSYREALLYVPVLMFASFLNSVIGFYAAIYVAKKFTRQVMNTSISAAIINLILTLSLVWYIEIWAAAISTLVAYGALAVYRHFDMKKYVTITYEPAILVSIFCAFSLVSIIYYVAYLMPQYDWLNGINVVLAGCIAIWLNGTLITKMLSYIRRIIFSTF